MPPGARRMEKFRANQVATEIRDEDHAGNADIKLIGNMVFCQRIVKQDNCRGGGICGVF